MADQETPARGKDSFACPRCGVWAHQKWSTLAYLVEDPLSGEYWTTFRDSLPRGVVVSGAETYGGDAQPPSDVAVKPIVGTPAANDGPGEWNVATCERCGETSVWRDDRMVYPSGSTAPMPHPDMPAEAKGIYSEARDVLPLSRRAGTALARAALERLLREIDPMPGNPKLFARIDQVVDRVSTSLGEMLTLIRHTGNEALHVADEPDEIMVLVLDPDEEEIVELIFESINDLVDELITRPAKRASAVARVPARVREGAKQARAKREGETS